MTGKSLGPGICNSSDLYFHGRIPRVERSSGRFSDVRRQRPVRPEYLLLRFAIGLVGRDEFFARETIARAIPIKGDRRFGSRCGRGRKRTASTTPKIAVVAPLPTVGGQMATTAKADSCAACVPHEAVPRPICSSHSSRMSASLHFDQSGNYGMMPFSRPGLYSTRRR